jgi:predicted XRE-type DNA-binding protein
MVKIEKSSGNVFADLGLPDSEEMLVKSELVAKIAEIIRNRKLKQREAAAILGMSQPKLSKMLRGQFQGISQAKLLEYLTLLGRDIQIVVGPHRRRKVPGKINVVFAA